MTLETKADIQNEKGSENRRMPEGGLHRYECIVQTIIGKLAKEGLAPQEPHPADQQGPAASGQTGSPAVIDITLATAR